VEECTRKKLFVLLAGRNATKLKTQSELTGLPFQVVATSDHPDLVNLLKQGTLVIHCGGPFQHTAKQMAKACLQAETHYTDIAGEYEVFEYLATLDDQAKQRSILLMPGTGFDVVPSDCLALHLKNRLPSATHLQLAFTMLKGGLSRGTSKTMVEGLGNGSCIRQNGKLICIKLGEKVKEINFGEFTTKALCIPWGDISTAWRSTGIANIEVYMGVSSATIRWAKISYYFTWLLRQTWLKKYLQKKIDQRPSGPDADRREKGRSLLWGKVWDSKGNECVSLLQTINGYALTAKTSVLIAQKILNETVRAGYFTPAQYFGSDLILEIEKITRTDLN
jgi:short subunit dehydrogenase-like uncharacterized protein